ncbi:MAG: hypothetical protein DMD35_20135 [Gemmatimonadetes bacterium]|nr:MAG: hypothetical protein DMD35_20135 [Gemmatimonadota bacterium]
MRTPPAARRAFFSTTLTFGLIMHAGAIDLPAQESVVAPGTKVRFELRSGQRLDGHVISLGSESLEGRFPTTGAAAKYPLADIAKLEVVRGSHRPVLRSATIGLLVGGSVGAIVGALAYDKPDLYVSSRAENAGFFAAVLGAPGLVVGGLVGLIPRDRWQRVTLDGRAPRINLRSLPAGRSGLGLALAF